MLAKRPVPVQSGQLLDGGHGRPRGRGRIRGQRGYRAHGALPRAHGGGGGRGGEAKGAPVLERRVLDHLLFVDEVGVGGDPAQLGHDLLDLADLGQHAQLLVNHWLQGGDEVAIPVPLLREHSP